MAAINALRGEAELVAGDRTLKLCFDVNGLCFAEEQMKLTTDEIVAKAAKEFAGWESVDPKAPPPRVNASFTRSLLWAALQKHHSGTHLIEAGEIMSDAGVGPTVAAVLNSLFAAFANDEEGGEDTDPPSQPQRGAAGTG